MTPRCPTSDECAANTEIEPDRFAIWCPQMGGYWSKTVIEPHERHSDSCFDAWSWYDGNLPLEDNEEPRRIHFCSASDIVEFGQKLLKIMDREETE